MVVPVERVGLLPVRPLHLVRDGAGLEEGSKVTVVEDSIALGRVPNLGLLLLLLGEGDDGAAALLPRGDALV